MAEPATRAEIRDLLRDYANVIDRKQLALWPGFFTEECSYRITTRENLERGFPLSIMLCANRAMLFDRVEATEKANIYEPHRYRHILGESEIRAQSPECVEACTGFLCVRVMLDGDSTVFACGEYHDEIVRKNERWLFRSRTVVLDASRVDTLMAIPL